MGKQIFELSNHLGNILATISDKKLQVSTNTTSTDYFEADVQTVQDYYAFGMQMPGRKLSGGYRYGFNGKENDNEVKGEGNQQDYGMRIYDGRIGKFLSVDPLSKSYPWNSPYSYAEGDVIRSVDLDGLEKVIVHTVSFAPFNYFGRDPWGTYGGDGNNRKFGDHLTSTVINNTTINNWRIRSEAVLDLATMKSTSQPKAIGSMSHYFADPPEPFSVPLRNSKFAYSKASFDGSFYAGSVPGFSGSSLVIDYHLKGGNSAAPFGAGADIDVNVKINFSKTNLAGEIAVNGRVFGDRFPSNENYLTDEKNNKLFLGVSGLNSNDADNAPYTELPFDNKRAMSDFNFTILFNKNNTFKGVRTPSGTEYNLADWNKLFSNLNPKSTQAGTSVGSTVQKKDDFKSNKKN